MRKSTLIIGILEAAFVLTAVYFEPSYCVRGTIHGEAFFDGRPTSWWRAELERWDVIDISRGRRLRPLGHISTMRIFVRTPSRFEHWSTRWMNDDQYTFDTDGPSLLAGDPDARTVLDAIKEDASPKIRRLVEIGLEKTKVSP